MDFALFTHVEPSLEPELRRLYRRHREAAAKIDWSYANLLPWEMGRDFRQHPWTPDQRHLSEPMYVAVETALLTEVNLPWFTASLDSLFRGGLTVLHDFLRSWTAEEDQHSDILQTYLLLSRNGAPDRLHSLRQSVITEGYCMEYHTPIEVMVFTTIQELATRAFYLNVAQTGQAEDPVLARLLRRLAKDETLHYGFYRDVIAAHLHANPNYVWPIAGVLRDFNMPGHTMPEYSSRMKTIAEHAGYGPAEYYHHVVNALIKYWGIADLQPTLAEAIAARHAILVHQQRLGRIVERAVRQHARGEHRAEA